MDKICKIKYVVIYCVFPMDDHKLAIGEIVYENTKRIHFTFEMYDDANKNIIGFGIDNYNYLSFYYKFFASNIFSFLHEPLLIEHIELCQLSQCYIYIYPNPPH